MNKYSFFYSFLGRLRFGYAVIATAFIVLTAVKFSMAAQANESVVVIDAWWNVDYAKNMCSRTDACSMDPTAEALDFEDRLATQLAVNPQCAGVFVAKYRGRNFDYAKTIMDAMQRRPHWTLVIDYVPEQQTQSWWLRLEGGPHMQGEGELRAIAANVCSILIEQGINILK
ncbi:MAG TPA: hypothetical protein VKT73_02585 [Xanthobacteraceae bacterium]|nr:hypothetical protein [Xanthobacteraceae bacterium]